MMNNNRQRYEDMSRRVSPGTVLQSNSGPINRRQRPPPSRYSEQENTHANIVLPMNYQGPIPPPLHVLQQIAPDYAQQLQHASWQNPDGSMNKYDGLPPPPTEHQMPPPPPPPPPPPQKPRSPVPVYFSQKAYELPRNYPTWENPGFPPRQTHLQTQLPTEYAPASLGYGQGTSQRYGMPDPSMMTSPHPGRVNPVAHFPPSYSQPARQNQPPVQEYDQQQHPQQQYHQFQQRRPYPHQFASEYTPYK